MKNWFRRHRRALLVSVSAAAVLAFAFWYGGAAPGLRGWSAASASAAGSSAASASAAVSAPASAGSASAAGSSAAAPDPAGSAGGGTSAQTDSPKADSPKADSPQAGSELASRPGGTGKNSSAADKTAAAAQIAGGAAAKAEQGDRSYSEQQGMQINGQTGKDAYQTAPVPEGKPVPVEPQDAVITDTEYTCTLSISCAAINDNLGWLDPDKAELVPEDGWLLKPTQVTFYGGESVFNVLQRTCKQQSIHMEYTNTPIYNTAYIEGIGNLYEFDCGELSGWMYEVNDWFPNYGCSRYQLQDGDVVEWMYTCNLGVDIGGYNDIG